MVSTKLWLRGACLMRKWVLALMMILLMVNLLLGLSYIHRARTSLNSRLNALDAKIVAAQVQLDKLKTNLAALEASVTQRMDELTEELITRTPYWEYVCYCDYLIKHSGRGQ